MNQSIQADADVMRALTAVLHMSLAHSRWDEQCRQVVELMRRLQPDALNVLRADATLALRQMDAAAAARALTVALEVGPAQGLSPEAALSMRTILAACLCAQEDAAGLHHAQAVMDEAVEGPAARFAKALLDVAAGQRSVSV